jgi:hypothetical protein
MGRCGGYSKGPMTLHYKNLTRIILNVQTVYLFRSEPRLVTQGIQVYRIGLLAGWGPSGDQEQRFPSR